MIKYKKTTLKNINNLLLPYNYLKSQNFGQGFVIQLLYNTITYWRVNIFKNDRN
jgi:hypothetical protein